MYVYHHSRFPVGRVSTKPGSQYPNPQLHGQGDLILASDHGSAHQTPRGTPDLEPNITLSRTPPSKRKKAVKPKDKVKRAALEKPLSELTKDLTQVPVKDTEAWVNRSFEERKAEKRDDGSIKRPSNSFMLYRSAYTERCRELEKSKNHQDISSIAGASWALETPAIKAQFEEWARVERENHQKAFPDYKFQPQTQAAKERKRKRKSDEASDETSDLEDPTWHNGRGVLEERAKSIRNKTPRSTYREYSNSPSFTSQDEASTPEPYMLSQNSSYIPDINLGKPLPMAMDRQSDYHHITSQPNTAYHAYDYAENYQYVDNAAFETYDSVSPPIGLPGGSHVDLMGDSSLDAGQMMFPSPSLLDPELQSHDHMSQVQAQALVSMAPPGSARSTGFHAGDYLNEGDSTPYLTSFDHVSLDS